MIPGRFTPAGWRAPAYSFEGHTAPLGLRFYDGKTFPERYRGAVFVAEHGTEASTRARPDQVDGDRISVIFLDQEGRVSSYEVFADGFFSGSNARYTRRPVDLLVLHDGSLLVTDDQADMIYRISYEP